MTAPEPIAPTRQGAFPPELVAVANRVETRVADVLAAEEAHWSRVDERLREPYAALRRLVLAGGKRLRPAFCYVAYVGAGGDPDDPEIVDVGAALELVHTFALVHDDVMDGSTTRRGADAVHHYFAVRHGDSGWLGEARRFGEGMAILVGDLALVEADRLLRGSPADAWDVWDRLRLELCIGQSLDLIGAARRTFDLEDARRVAVFKSALYTVERPLHLGAALAGSLGTLRDPLSAVGRPLGEAFQLRDDLLGAFGDPRITGKPVGDDLREGKPTPLIALAQARAGAAGRALLGRIGARDLTEGEIEALHSLLLTTGAAEAVEEEIERLVATAAAAIDAVPLTPAAKALLHALAEYVAWRDR
jgi:geranylgeranyl diphosphate synthase type I